MGVYSVCRPVAVPTSPRRKFLIDTSPVARWPGRWRPVTHHPLSRVVMVNCSVEQQLPAANYINAVGGEGRGWGWGWGGWGWGCGSV